MSLSVILSSIALLAVDSTEAMPHLWFDVSKRAAASDVIDTTSKAVKAAAEDTPPFANKPTTTEDKATTTKASAKSTSAKATSSAKPSHKPSSSAKEPSSSSLVPSSSPSSSSISPTSVLPPLVVTPPNTSSSSSNATATPTSQISNLESGGGVSGGAIGGIVAAIIIIIGGFAAYFILRKKKANKQRGMNTKPDPFTMGFGSDQGFNNSQQYQPQMQQNNLSVNTYQHQYGTTSPPQPSIAVTSPTSPTSPYNNNYYDANNHIIAESMTTAPYQPQQYQAQQQYQPQTVQQYQQPETMMQENTSAVSMGGLAPTPAVAATAVAVVGATAADAATLTAVAPLLAPTQAGSVGVFYVGATYTPTLSDEIDIQTGDQVEVLVEYDDGWCQGINLSRGNAKGVFPKHCIDYGSAEQQQPATATAAAVAAAAPTSVQSGNEVDRVKRISSMYIA